MISYRTIDLVYSIQHIAGSFTTLIIGIANLILISSEFETSETLKTRLIVLSVFAGIFVIYETFYITLPYDFDKLAGLVIAILGNAAVWYFTFLEGEVNGLVFRAGLLLLGIINSSNGATWLYEFFKVKIHLMRKD